MASSEDIIKPMQQVLVFKSAKMLMFSVCSQRTLHRPVRSRASSWPSSRVILAVQLYLCTVFEQIPPRKSYPDRFFFFFCTLLSHLSIFPFKNAAYYIKMLDLHNFGLVFADKTTKWL